VVTKHRATTSRYLWGVAVHPADSHVLMALAALVIVGCSGEPDTSPLCYPSNRPGVKCEPPTGISR
jgi:hypothetical protein